MSQAVQQEQPSGGQSGDQPDPRRWRALAVCLIGGFMVLLDVSIVNVALPSIQSGLHASQSDLQWVVSGYALTFGLLLVPAGRVGDARGRRTMFTVALGLFSLASLACGLAPGATWLVIFRLVQGLAGGLLTPQISAVIQQMFRGRERGTAFGLFGTMVGVSTAIGPLLGGVLISLLGTGSGWRYVFFINLPIGLVAIPFALKLLPAPDEEQQKGHDYDPVGVGLLGIGVVVLLMPLVQEQQWHGALKWLLIPAALAVLGAFLAWERHYTHRGKEPVVDLSLFDVRSFSFGTAMITVYFAGFTPLFFIFTLYLQDGLNYSALLAGLAIIPFALGSGAAAALGGRIVHDYGRALVALGLIMVIVGFIGTIVAVRVVPTHGTGWATAAPLLIAGLGSGLVIAPNQTLTLSQVPVRRAGTAGGVLQVGQRVGAAVGIAAVGSVFFARVAAPHGHGFASAYRTGITVAAIFVGAALLFALADIVVDKRLHSREHGAERDGADPAAMATRAGARARQGSGAHAKRVRHGERADPRPTPAGRHAAGPD